MASYPAGPRPWDSTGAGGGIRTPDRLITNQLLYQTELRQPDKACSLARSVPDLQPHPFGLRLVLSLRGARANHLFSPVWRFRAKWPGPSNPLGRATSLSGGLEQHHPRSHRYVQTVHMAGHWNRYRQLTALPHEAAEACALGAEDDRGRQREVHRVVSLNGVPRKPHGPHMSRL